MYVTGGYRGDFLNSAELYDPSTKLWEVIGSMNHARCDHTASVLTNGSVLVTGGNNVFSSSLNSAELYDPSTGTWKTTDSLNYARYLHTVSILTNGRILVAGGRILDGRVVSESAELY